MVLSLFGGVKEVQAARATAQAAVAKRATDEVMWFMDQ